MKRATFIDHKVTLEGVYIRGITGPGLLPDVEIFVSRDDAEAFGWIDPLTEDEQRAQKIARYWQSPPAEQAAILEEVEVLELQAEV